MKQLTRITSESLRLQVYKQLKERLVSGFWKPGEKLPSELELCKIFGVSRVTVRAAIQQLEILGLVETRQGNGTTVTQFSSISALEHFHPLVQIHKNKDLIHVLQYRKVVESGAIAMAVDKFSEEDFAYLEEKLAVMKATTKNLRKHAKADFQFHHRVAECTGNPVIIKVYALIHDMISDSMADVVDLLGCEIGLKYHRLLIEALKKRDKGLCQRTMEEHLQKTIDALEDSDLPGPDARMVVG